MRAKRIELGQAVRFDFCDRKNLAGRVVEIIANSEPSPLSRGCVALVAIDGETVYLKRLSELMLVVDRVGHIIACQDEIGL